MLRQGAIIAAAGVVAGTACGYLLAKFASSYFHSLQMPGIVPLAVAALVLLFAAVVASFVPAARAARVDVIQALRSE